MKLLPKAEWWNPLTFENGWVIPSPTLLARNYFSILELNLIHIGKGVPVNLLCHEWQGGTGIWWVAPVGIGCRQNVITAELHTFVGGVGREVGHCVYGQSRTLLYTEDGGGHRKVTRLHQRQDVEVKNFPVGREIRCKAHSFMVFFYNQMRRLHADIWSHPVHYPVDDHISPWSSKGHRHDYEWPTMSIGLDIPEIQRFKKLTLKIQGQGHDQGQNLWLHLRPSMQSIRSFSFRGSWIIFGWDIIKSIFDWKYNVKVIAKVKPGGHIWGIEFKWYVFFVFHVNLTILADI